MEKVIGNTIEELAKSYANEQCRCYKCDGIDNFTHKSCKLSLDEGCQEHRWKEMGYVRGAKDQIEKTCEWLTQLFDRDDYGLGVNTEKVVSQFRKAMRVTQSAE